MSPIKSSSNLQVATNYNDEWIPNEEHIQRNYRRNMQDNPPEPPTDGRAVVCGRNRQAPIPTEQLEPVEVDNGMKKAINKDLTSRNIRNPKTKLRKKTTN